VGADPPDCTDVLDTLPQENLSIDQHVFFESPFSRPLFITVVDGLGHGIVKIPKF
jgi:hypothetical protein